MVQYQLLPLEIYSHLSHFSIQRWNAEPHCRILDTRWKRSPGTQRRMEIDIDRGGGTASFGEMAMMVNKIACRNVLERAAINATFNPFTTWPGTMGAKDGVVHKNVLLVDGLVV
jgi:hypothetical protein